MDFDEYQTEAHKMANYNPFPCIVVKPTFTLDGIKILPAYPFIKVMAESAEIAQPAIKSAFRGDDTLIIEEELEKEIGDILWYCAEMATALGVSLKSIAGKNIEKLTRRKKRNKIKGSGDNR